MTTWTAAQDATLAELWRNGETGAACAAALNARFGLSLSRNAVLSRLHRKVGADRAKRSPLRAEQVLAKVEPASQPKRGVRQALARAGAGDRPQPWTPPKAAAPYVPPPHPRGFDQPRAEKTGPVSLLDLRDHHCRWPVGDSRSGSMRYCGCRKAASGPRGGVTPYCSDHSAVAFSAPEPRRRSA